MLDGGTQRTTLTDELAAITCPRWRLFGQLTPIHLFRLADLNEAAAADACAFCWTDI